MTDSTAVREKIYVVGGQIKAINNSNEESGGILVPFTSESKKDLDGEFFDKDTVMLLEVHPIEGKPRLYNHGQDEVFTTVPTGKFTKASITDEGLYVTTFDNFKDNFTAYLKSYAPKMPDAQDWLGKQLKELDMYDEMLKNLRGEGMLKYSSGAYVTSVIVNKSTGHIEQWFIEEGSETLTPAMPYGLTKVVNLKSLRQAISTAYAQPKFKSIADYSHNFQEPTQSPETTQASESNVDDADLGGDLKRDSEKKLPSEKDSQMTEKTKKMLSEEEMEAVVNRAVEAVMARMQENKADGDDMMDDEDYKNVADDLKTEVDAKMEDDEEGDIEAKAFDIILEALPKAVAKAMDAKALRDGKIDDAIYKASRQNNKGKSTTGQGSHNEKFDTIGASEDLRFAHLTAEELQANYLFTKAFNPMSRAPGRKTMGMFHGDTTFLNHLVHKSIKAEDNFKDPKDGSIVKSSKPWKADEINASNITGFGDEWIGVFYSSTLWEKVRNQRIYSMMQSKGMWEQEVPQGYESTFIPTEGADATVYTRQQANDIGSYTRIETTSLPSQIATGRVQLTPGELTAMVGVTQQAQEDSLIPFLPQVNRQLQETMLEHIDKVMINADTETGASTNINLIDGTPSSTITSKPYYLVTNGYLKYALVTGSSTKRDGGALDENDYRLTYKLMPTAIREQKERLAFIIDSETHDASLDIAAIKTDDVRITNATITSGVIMNIWGIDVLRSGFMPTANSAGKVPAAGAALGRILCVYAPYWAMGWKRNITFEYDYDIYSATNLIAVSMRLGLAARGAGASTVSYNLTV